ncbi:MAG: isochorismate synthase [Oculatellaceae cyanobacterium Prado106]|jgi:menaquinone-specific isochorismate synthase|nr:isochorismate synthase [Oculatellaceae cyanobacterium Prado106]
MLCQPSISALSSPRDCKQLYQFLDFCKQQSLQDRHSKIASIALEVPCLDPLVVLQQWSRSDQVHFYFENQDAEKAIAAIDAVSLHQADGSQRFVAAQQFTQDCMQHFITNSHPSPWSTPRFFCSFTFSDQSDSRADAISHDSRSFARSGGFAAGTVFLPKWQVMRSHNQSMAIANLSIHRQSNIEQLTQKIWQQFQQLCAPQYSLLHFPQGMPPSLEPRQPWQMGNVDNFRTAVVGALRSIQAQQLHKLVLAHAVDVTSSLPFQAVPSLHNLRQRHPDCTVFSVGNGQGQSFIGASPERLLSLHQGRLVTDALAGSAPRGKTMAEDDAFAQRLMQTDKERREHQVVVDFIAQRLVQLGLQPKYASSPKILPLSNIQHLHTPIRTLVSNPIHPFKILAELHPTPAVAGMPRDIACQHIQHYEKFGRSLYAAPLGWLDTQGNAEFVVGIRSALLDGHRARLYAGAGIVAGSDPDRELAEIKLKFQALLQALV